MSKIAVVLGHFVAADYREPLGILENYEGHCFKHM